MYGDLTSDSLIYGRLFDGDNNGILGYYSGIYNYITMSVNIPINTISWDITI